MAKWNIRAQTDTIYNRQKKCNDKIKTTAPAVTTVNGVTTIAATTKGKEYVF